MKPCPECGAPARHFYVASGNDPDDVDPAAECTNPACGWFL